jgi:hypothetical protein
MPLPGGARAYAECDLDGTIESPSGNPNGPSLKEQEQPLLLELRTAKNAKQVEVAVLSTI